MTVDAGQDRSDAPANMVFQTRLTVKPAPCSAARQASIFETN